MPCLRWWGGRPAPVPEVPWFWSDQYDLRLQIAGLAFDPAEAVLRGDPASGSFAVFHLGADGRVLAVEAVNAPADFMAGRLLVARQVPAWHTGPRRQIGIAELPGSGKVAPPHVFKPRHAYRVAAARDEA